MRLFYAIEIPNKARKAIHGYLDRCGFYRSENISFVKGDNLHITIMFLGEQDPEKILQIDKIKMLAAEIIKAPLEIYLEEFGAFVHRGGKQRTFWIGVSDPSGTLQSLHAGVKEVMIEEKHIPKTKTKIFTPHITVGRSKRGTIDIKNFPPFPRTAFTISRLTLFSSSLKPSGAEYSIVKRY